MVGSILLLLFFPLGKAVTFPLKNISAIYLRIFAQNVLMFSVVRRLMVICFQIRK